VHCWYAWENAAKQAVMTGLPQTVDHIRLNGFEHSIEPMTFDMAGPFLRMRLPSGRHLHYLRPKIEERETPWKEMRWTLTYEGKASDDDASAIWGRSITRGAKLWENGIQAIANDQLRVAMKQAKRVKLNTVLHAHDEIGVMERVNGGRKISELIECMTHKVDWNRTMPLKALGSEMISWRKD
jgi:DNA polymerase